MANQGNKNNMTGIMFMLLIVLAVVFISHRYILPIVWSVLIVIASWPLYTRWTKYVCRGHKTTAALTITLLALLLVVVPLIWLTIIISQELIALSQTLLTLNLTGIPQPAWLGHLPYIGDKLIPFWHKYLAKPHFLSALMVNFHDHYQSISGPLKSLGGKTLHGTVSLLFTLLALFFFYRDGEKFSLLINKAGNKLLARRWQRYFVNLPSAIRGVVNGTVLVGLITGILMGVLYALIGLPFAGVFGLLTAFFSMIPYGLLAVLAIVVLIMLAKASYIFAIVILILGLIISFAADHFIKPILLGNSTKLPFLLILIGVLGGVENIGLIGLFVGPVIMVLLCHLFAELTE